MPNFTAGTSFTDGVTNDVTAAKLNALVADAVPTSSLALASTSGTISNFTSSTANITLGTIPTLTAGTTTGTAGIFTSGTITTALIPTGTFGTTTSTAATITTGTIPNLTAGTTTSTAATITTGTIPTLTAGTTTGTAGIFTSGTVATLNSTTGTITNLSTTLAGDFTISQGTGTLGTTGATLGTYGGATSVPVLAINAKGQVTSTGTAAITSGFTGFRNRIINGDMRIDQRNAGASQTFTAAAALAYSVDRFYGYCTGANVTGQRVAGTAPNEFVYRFTGAASVTAIGFGTRLEATNTTDLAGSTATLSVQLANSLLTTVTWTAYYANTADAFGTLASPTRTQIATGTFTVTSTLTTYSAQISVPSAATTGIEIVFTVGAQTSGTWTIDNVQLEAGSTATEFERRPYGTELMLCQRYFEKSAGQSTSISASSQNTLIANVPSTSIANGVYYYNAKFAVTKRTSATVTTYPYTTPSNTTRLSNDNGTDFGANSGNVGIATDSMFAINNLSGGAITTGAQLIIIGNWYASAEL
jgi:hypothetical protein